VGDPRQHALEHGTPAQGQQYLAGQPRRPHTRLDNRDDLHAVLIALAIDPF